MNIFVPNTGELLIPAKAHRLSSALQADDFVISHVDAFVRSLHLDRNFDLSGQVIAPQKSTTPRVAPDEETRKFITKLFEFRARLPDQGASAHDEVTADRGLGLAGDFSASAELAAIWVDGLMTLGTLAGRRVSPAGFDAKQEFSKLLSDWLGTLGQQLRYKKRPDVSLTDQNRIKPLYQIQLCDAFLVIPDQAARFLELLRLELLESLRSGCEISGAWGKLVSTRFGELRFELTAPDYVFDPAFIESKEVE